MNRYPLWKYILIVLIIGAAALYAAPNLYPRVPALQVSPVRGAEISDLTRYDVEGALEDAGIEPLSVEVEEVGLNLRFADEPSRQAARQAVADALGSGYVAALTLVPETPSWLRALGAEPMFLGLDLRGGVHFLMEVDMSAAMEKAEERYVSDLRGRMRSDDIRYKTIVQHPNGGILIRFRDVAERDKAAALLDEEFADLSYSSTDEEGEVRLVAVITEEQADETRKLALQQNITTLRKRVNELGVAEPIVQQQGDERIVVQLPGVQDTTRAKEILGATATLEFRMVAEDHDPREAEDGRVPPGTLLHRDRNDEPVLLRKQLMLTGDRIVDAASGFGQDGGGPEVNITLDGKGGRMFTRATEEEVGKRMAVVFIESRVETKMEDGEQVKHKRQISEVINIATIQETLGKRFRITGLDSPDEARNLALLLRAGALAAPIEIIEERTVGPSLGRENIERGFNSVIIGFIAVLIFMALYYRSFGLIADVALALNLVLIVSMLSLLQATLTLPGIAGIVLTVGMAVDANVLIFERIREEVRNGNTPQASIRAGYEKAFSTIADANITTLIAAVVLFSFGTGPIRGFAVTLSLGILSSMFTAIMVSRGLVNLLYGQRNIAKLPI